MFQFLFSRDLIPEEQKTAAKSVIRNLCLGAVKRIKSKYPNSDSPYATAVFGFKDEKFTKPVFLGVESGKTQEDIPLVDRSIELLRFLLDCLMEARAIATSGACDFFHFRGGAGDMPMGELQTFLRSINMYYHETWSGNLPDDKTSSVEELLNSIVIYKKSFGSFCTIEEESGARSLRGIAMAFLGYETNAGVFSYGHALTGIGHTTNGSVCFLQMRNSYRDAEGVPKLNFMIVGRGRNRKVLEIPNGLFEFTDKTKPDEIVVEARKKIKQFKNFLLLKGGADA